MVAYQKRCMSDGPGTIHCIAFLPNPPKLKSLDSNLTQAGHLSLESACVSDNALVTPCMYLDCVLWDG